MSEFELSYDQVEHYNSSMTLEPRLEVEIRVFSVYGDAEGDIKEEFQMIKYKFDQDVKEGLTKFRQKADEFSSYKFFPIIGDYAAPSEATVMINSNDRVEIADLAEDLIQQVHEEIGL